MYYGMIKPLPVMTGNVLGKTGRASELGNIPNIMVKPLPVMSSNALGKTVRTSLAMHPT
jgi:hypothetical protein